jgi:hypothetical protein
MKQICHISLANHGAVLKNKIRKGKEKSFHLVVHSSRRSAGRLVYRVLCGKKNDDDDDDEKRRCVFSRSHS